VHLSACGYQNGIARKIKYKDILGCPFLENALKITFKGD